MNKEQMDNCAYKLMIKNNPDEAVKNLLLKDKKNEKLKEIIKEAREKAVKLQEKYNYILDDLIFLLGKGE